MIRIRDNISIGENELVFKVSRSAGPGGQNVNKVNTRVTVLFNVGGSSLSGTQKEQIQRHLSNRVDKSGLMRVVSQRHRTQKANRNAAVERLTELLAKALEPETVRRKTKVPYTARKRRLEKKRQRSFIKRQRTKKNFTEDFDE